MTSSTTDTTNRTEPSPRFDPTFTANVINAMGPATTPRMRVVMGLLIQHLHDFAREAELTVDEWMAGVEMINWAGKMSDDKRNEGQLMCDVIGVESLVDEITYKLAQEADNPATASAILGPFWRHDTPHYPNGTSIVENCPDGEITYMHGKVIDAETKKPLPGVNVDVWQASTNGLYEQQDPDQREHNLRGVFETDSNGEYGFYCIRPTPYPVPGDGPAGKLLKLMDRHPMRPAHIHIIATIDTHKPLTTQIFDRNDQYLENDSVFAVKDSLVVDFVPIKDAKKLENGQQPTLELVYDISLAPRK